MTTQPQHQPLVSPNSRYCWFRNCAIVTASVILCFYAASSFFGFSASTAKDVVVVNCSNSRGATPHQVLPPDVFSTAKMPLSSRYKIPKILHQTWKNNNPPTKYAKYRQSWLKAHPDWVHHLWTDDENRHFVKQHYPSFLSTYDDFPVGIMRADAIRYLYMHHYGGVYADMDMEPLRNLDFLIDNATTPVTVAYLGTSFEDISNNIPPAFLISEPGHVLWMLVIRGIVQVFDKKQLQQMRVEDVTGPAALSYAILGYTRAGAENMMAPRDGNWSPNGSITSGSSQVGDIKVLEPGLIYPFHFNQALTKIGDICWGVRATQNETQCKALFPNAYTIMYHSHSWREDWRKFQREIG